MTTQRISPQIILSLIVFASPVAFAAEGYKDTPLIPGTQWHVHDPDRPKPRIITSGKTFSEMAAPPSDAIVLFDGKDLSKWKQGDGSPAKWKVENG